MLLLRSDDVLSTAQKLIDVQVTCSGACVIRVVDRPPLAYLGQAYETHLHNITLIASSASLKRRLIYKRVCDIDVEHST